MLTELRQSLEQFDAAMVSGAEARATHVRASAELRRLADEAVQGVKVLDRFNRVRFRGTPEGVGGVAECEQHDGTVARGEDRA